MRIGHCQLDSKVGDFEANLAKFALGHERADRERVEVVSFPECFLSGYPDDEARARAGAFEVESPAMRRVIESTLHFDPTVIVGFNELRGRDLYNTAAVIHRGHLLGTYSKCSAYMPFHKQGREFPVFERGGVKFGIVICSDGGYIEPSRILAAKGAKIIFSPHYNAIGRESLLTHLQTTRADHVARAIENRVYFVRGNNVHGGGGDDPAMPNSQRVAYGESYIFDPIGEVVVHSRRFHEDFIFADVDPAMAEDRNWKIGRSLWSHREFGKMFDEAVKG
jgi:predicted amidohydrolase